MKTIELDDRVEMCAECFAAKPQCACGSTRPGIRMSRMIFEIIQIQEDRNAPIKMVSGHDIIDAELIKSSGVVG